jgi:hypothetical protein
LRVSCLKNSPPNFQPRIRSITAPELGRKRAKVGTLFLHKPAWIRAIILRFWGWKFSGEFLRREIINFTLRVGNPLTLAHPIVQKPAFFLKAMSIFVENLIYSLFKHIWDFLIHFHHLTSRPKKPQPIKKSKKDYSHNRSFQSPCTNQFNAVLISSYLHNSYFHLLFNFFFNIFFNFIKTLLFFHNRKSKKIKRKKIHFQNTPKEEK